MSEHDIFLPKDRYKAALARLRDLIAEGRSLLYETRMVSDERVIYCSWGLCASDATTWPDAEDHLWPEDFAAFKRAAPKWRRDEHQCPMDVRSEDGYASSRSCFHTCRIFQSLRRQKRRDQRLRQIPTREEALALYDAQIKRMRKK